jgi:hypothetical protein
MERTTNYKSLEMNLIRVAIMRKKLVLFVITVIITLQFTDSVSAELEEPALPDLSDLPYVIYFKLIENKMPWWRLAMMRR